MTSHSLDACLQLVADRQRRQVIHYLRHEANGTTTFDDLVNRLYSGGSDFKNGPVRDRDQLAIQLRHAHLPKLAEYGVVELGPRSGVVRYQPDDQVETVLDSLPGEVSLPNP